MSWVFSEVSPLELVKIWTSPIQNTARSPEVVLFLTSWSFTLHISSFKFHQSLKVIPIKISGTLSLFSSLSCYFHMPNPSQNLMSVSLTQQDCHSPLDRSKLTILLGTKGTYLSSYLHFLNFQTSRRAVILEAALLNHHTHSYSLKTLLLLMDIVQKQNS